MFARAHRHCEGAAAMGPLTVPTHLNATSDHCCDVGAMPGVHKSAAPWMGLPLGALLWHGLTRTAVGRARLTCAPETGGEVAGGNPYFKRMVEKGVGFDGGTVRFATERGRMRELHWCGTDDLHSRHIEILAV